MTRSTVSEFLIERAVRATGLSAIVFVVMIFLFLIREGAPALLEVSSSDLLTTRWYPIEEYYGLVPLILGSLLVTFGAAFGYTVMARISLFIGRLQFLLGDWLGLLR